MDYTEQFIRLNCSLMSDYKMMKLNAEMKCMGIGLYIQMILFKEKATGIQTQFLTNWICWLNNGGYSGRSAASH